MPVLRKPLHHRRRQDRRRRPQRPLRLLRHRLVRDAGRRPGEGGSGRARSPRVGPAQAKTASQESAPKAANADDEDSAEDAWAAAVNAAVAEDKPAATVDDWDVQLGEAPEGNAAASAAAAPSSPAKTGSSIDALFENNTDAPDTSGHQWDAKTDEAEPEPEPAPEPAPAPAPRRRPPPPPPKPGVVARLRAIAATPLAIGLAGLGLLAGAYLGRERVVAVFPSAAPLFAAVGQPVNLAGLEFGEVRSSLVHDGEARFLVVEAVVRNPLERPVTVPQIETTLRAADRRSLYVWTADPPRATLRPGESLHFRTRLATPPEEGREVALRFAAGGDRAQAKP